MNEREEAEISIKPIENIVNILQTEIETLEKKIRDLQLQIDLLDTKVNNLREDMKKKIDKYKDIEVDIHG